MSIDPATAGTAISAVSSVLGGFGSKSKAPSYYPYLKALVGPKLAKSQTMSDSLAQHQRNMIGADFQARMDAASKHGLHPLTALGMNFSGSSPAVEAFQQSGNQVDYAGMGQDVSRALGAYASRDERALASAQAALQIENGSLQNELLRSQIRRLNSAGTPRGLSLNPLISGQSGVGVEVLPNRVTHGGATETGRSPALQTMNYGGSDIQIPGDVFQDAAMDDGPASGYIQWTRTLPQMLGADIDRIASRVRQSLFTRKGWSDWWRSRDNPYNFDR